MPGTESFVRWTQDVIWLRKSDTRFVLFWDGLEGKKLPVKEFSTHWDYRGFLTSMFPGGDAMNFAKVGGLGPEDRLYVEGITTIKDEPVRVVEGQSELCPMYESLASSCIYVGDDTTLDQVHAERSLGAKAEWMLSDRLVAEIVTSSSREIGVDLDARHAELVVEYGLKKGGAS